MAEELKIREPEDRVFEWEVGLPTSDNLTPLSQNLIPPELAAAFSITPEPHRSILELNREAQNTLSSLSGSLHSNFKAFADESEDPDPDGSVSGSESRKIRRLDSGGGVEEADIFNDDLSAKTQKRPRLVWTPQLHKRFVDVVAHLGLKNAVPKTIMQLMNVEGLTRENVASHLQKYRLYLKRMSGLSNDGPSPSDHLFASTPVPQSLQEPAVPMPMTYPPMMPYGMGHGNTASSGAYHGYESHPYQMVQQRDWSGSR
jgi:SHAQKYF class myb-like DNA-binding protein